MNFPENLQYTKDHEWVRFDGEYAYIGITEFAQRELGDIVYVDITEDGEEVGAGEVFGSVEAVKTVSDLFMPIKGEIVEVNEEIESQPELVNKDPYGKGWIIKVKIEANVDRSELMNAEAYSEIAG